MIDLIIDGGYLSWCYGPSVMMHRAWTTGSRELFSISAGAFICMDAPELWRAEVFPEYKSKRKQKNLLDADRREKKKHVIQFQQDHLLADPSLQTLMIDGCEADDLVIMMVQLGHGDTIFGTDKDLLQLPKDFSLLKKDNTEMTIEAYAKKAPKSIQKLITTPKDIFVDLVVRGDKSDSIPSVLPPRRMDLYKIIHYSDKPLQAAYDLFGEQVLKNIEVALLPGPNCLANKLKPRELLSYAESGEYWRIPLRNEIIEIIQHALEERGFTRLHMKTNR